MINQRQFGVWMDTQHATVVGKSIGSDKMVVLGHINGEEVSPNAGNNHDNTQKQMQQGKFFKEITLLLQNATHLHATGTGQVQEQFLHYLAETAQFKNTKTEESTANRMSDERLVEFFEGKFN